MTTTQETFADLQRRANELAPQVAALTNEHQELQREARDAFCQERYGAPYRVATLSSIPFTLYAVDGNGDALYRADVGRGARTKYNWLVRKAIRDGVTSVGPIMPRRPKAPTGSWHVVEDELRFGLKYVSRLASDDGRMHVYGGRS